MLNTHNYNASNVKINAVNGTIVKNYKDSFFKYFDLTSNFAKTVFDTNTPHVYINGDKKQVVILQMMMCGDKTVLCELMWKKDFDKLFEYDGTKPRD